MSDIVARLRALEQRLRRRPGLGSLAGQRQRFNRQFLAESPEHAALVEAAAERVGTRDIGRLVFCRRDDGSELLNELRDRVGDFCRRHRCSIPGVRTIRVRPIDGPRCRFVPGGGD
ncbi:MAG: hypothetical protein ACM359_15605 [Bacillota bacterium]